MRLCRSSFSRMRADSSFRRSCRIDYMLRLDAASLSSWGPVYRLLATSFSVHIPPTQLSSWVSSSQALEWDLSSPTAILTWYLERSKQLTLGNEGKSGQSIGVYAFVLWSWRDVGTAHGDGDLTNIPLVELLFHHPVSQSRFPCCPRHHFPERECGSKCHG